MTLLSLGCGFGLGIALVGSGELHLTRIVYAPLPWWELALAVVAAASSIAMLERAWPIYVPWVFGSCGVAEPAYRGFAALPVHQLATFGGALVVGLVTNVARALRPDSGNDAPGAWPRDSGSGSAQLREPAVRHRQQFRRCRGVRRRGGDRGRPDRHRAAALAAVLDARARALERTGAVLARP